MTENKHDFSKIQLEYKHKQFKRKLKDNYNPSKIDINHTNNANNCFPNSNKTEINNTNVIKNNIDSNKTNNILI